MLVVKLVPPFKSIKPQTKSYESVVKSLFDTVGKQFPAATYLERASLVLCHGHHVVVPLVLHRRVGLCTALQEHRVTLRRCPGLRLTNDTQPTRRPGKPTAAPT